jgi:hypothetical protein
MNKHNGWTNYATWRINLEIFDGMDWLEQFGNTDPYMTDDYELGQALKSYVEDYLSETTDGGLALDYALAFINDVNFQEIASSMINEYCANNPESITEEA